MAPSRFLRPLQIPPRTNHLGLVVHGQFVHFDAGAAQGIAFSRGLAVAIGN